MAAKIDTNELINDAPMKPYFLPYKSIALDAIIAPIAIPTTEIDIGKVSVGQKVTIRVSAFREEVFQGTVTKIEPLATIEQGVTIFPVLIDIENKDIVLAMVQSLSMKEYDSGTFSSFGLAVFDECHHLGAEVFSKSMQKLSLIHI